MTFVFVFDPRLGHYVLSGYTTQISCAGWNPTEKPYVPEYSAFDNPPDPPELKICRGCSEADSVDEWVSFGVKESHKSTVHPCDGNGCQCPMCDIVRTIRDMNRDWDLSDQIKTWPAD